jgi:hypothetical protein
MRILSYLQVIEFNQTNMDVIRGRVADKLDMLVKDYTCMLYGGEVGEINTALW